MLNLVIFINILRILYYTYSAGKGGVENDVVIRGAVIPKFKRFSYLGSIIQ